MKLITKIFIVIDFLIICCFFLVYGPIDKARVFWITTSMETMNHKYLAHIFYSNKTINEVLKSNYYIDVNEETDASKVTTSKVEKKTTYESIYEQEIIEREENALYKLIEFKYKEFDCHLVAIYDSTRIEAAVANGKPNGKGRILSDIAAAEGAIVAINGGGYRWANGYPVGLVIKNGELIYASASKDFLTAGFTNDGVLTVGKLNTNNFKEKNIKSGLSFSPALIVNGIPITIIGTGGSGMNPRTVIAQRKDGIVLFLVVNGYNQSVSWKGRGGVYLNDLLIILQRYGAYNAMNMDGGSSTTMVINGKLINSPVEPQKQGQDFIRTAWILK